jgi:hypothetical protein
MAQAKQSQDEDHEHCRHEGCGKSVLDINVHMQEHRESHEDVGDAECCTDCDYHSPRFVVVRENSTTGPYIVDAAGCECDEGSRAWSKADMLEDVFVTFEDAEAAARRLNEAEGHEATECARLHAADRANGILLECDCDCDICHEAEE